jgi:gas vesicle protein
MKNSNNMASFTLGLLFGAVVGTVAGLFAAPKSGEETRTYIVDELTKLRDQAEDVMSDLSGASGQWATKAKQVIQEKIDSVNDILKSAREAEDLVNTEIDDDFSEFLGGEDNTGSEVKDNKLEEDKQNITTSQEETPSKVE